jgi:endonuclease/exonuclease/phosphatase family metal-dependent hydrolase
LHDQPNLTALGEALAAIDADLAGLNEVFYPRKIIGSALPALEALASHLQMHFVFGPCLRWPAQDALPADAYGNALLSRWPIIASSAHHLTPKEEDAQGLLRHTEQRGLLEGRILLPDGRSFTAYVTHLDHSDEEKRLIMLRVARTWLGRDRNRPHIVMGDFNAISRFDYANNPDFLPQLTTHPWHTNQAGGEKGPRVAAQMEKAGYVDVYTRFGTPGIATYLPHSAPPLRIDYLFASQALADRCRQCTILSAYDGVSDHRPVLAEFAFP